MEKISRTRPPINFKSFIVIPSRISRYSPKKPKPSKIKVAMIADLLTVEMRSFLDNLLVNDEKTGMLPTGSRIARSVINDWRKIMRLISATEVIHN